MEIASLREAMHQQPFKSFTIRTVDGRSFEIRHPDFLAVHPRRVEYTHHETGVRTVLEPLLIVAIDFPKA